MLMFFLGVSIKLSIVNFFNCSFRQKYLFEFSFNLVIALFFVSLRISWKKRRRTSSLTVEIKEDLLFLPQNNNIMSKRVYFDDTTVALGALYTVFLIGVILAIVFFG